MAALKRIKQKELPFILDGRTIIKSVTKNTTCSDVINKLPNLQIPLAVFEKVDGIEKELTGKTKLLKVWRTYGSAKKVEFVIRKSHMVTKVKKSTPKVSSASKNCKNISVKSAQGKELSKDTLKQVSDLAFYVRYQKTKVEALNKKSDNNTGSSEQNRLMRRMTSNASVNSMDAFLVKADLNEMAKFLSFCGEVTAEKLGKVKPRKQNVDYSEETANYEAKQMKDIVTSGTKVKKHVIHENLKSMKLGFKQKFAPKKKVERSTSTGTISSTDTGYHSVGSEGEGQNSSDDNRSKTSAICFSNPKRHTSMLSDITDGPRHSTPIFAGRTQKRRADDFEITLTADNTFFTDTLEQMNEVHGKTVILEKFMADQTMPVSSAFSRNDVCDSPDVKRRRMERYSMPAFSSQQDVCRFLWNSNCDSDSDSDSESDISQPCESLDVAFNAGDIDVNDTLRSQPRTLRRESAISNLNRFSLLSRNTGLDTLDESNSFDYSFDCSFPRVDDTHSEDFTMDFSCDFDNSDSENEADNNEDDFMDSFMNTRYFLDASGDITACELKDEFNNNSSNSDEGIYSFCSGSVIDCRELEMII